MALELLLDLLPPLQMKQRKLQKHSVMLLEDNYVGNFYVNELIIRSMGYDLFPYDLTR